MMICHDIQSSAEITRLAYEHTTRALKLRSLFAFMHAIRGDRSLFETSQGWPREHLAVVIWWLMEHRRVWAPELVTQRVDLTCELFLQDQTWRS